MHQILKAFCPEEVWQRQRDPLRRVSRPSSSSWEQLGQRGRLLGQRDPREALGGKELQACLAQEAGKATMARRDKTEQRVCTKKVHWNLEACK